MSVANHLFSCSEIATDCKIEFEIEFFFFTKLEFKKKGETFERASLTTVAEINQ